MKLRLEITAIFVKHKNEQWVNEKRDKKVGANKYNMIQF